MPQFAPEPAILPTVLHYQGVPVPCWPPTRHSCVQPGFSTPNAPHRTPFPQPPTDGQGDAADPAQKKPKSGEETEKSPNSPGSGRTAQPGPSTEALEQPAAAGSHSPRITRRRLDIVEIQNSRWLFLGGFFFFFALPHFQGNKTPCHLPVAIEISPDSASAEEKAGLLAAAEEPRAATAFKLTGKSGDKWGFI